VKVKRWRESLGVGGGVRDGQRPADADDFKNRNQAQLCNGRRGFDFFSGSLAIPAGFNSDGAQVSINVGGVQKALTLNAKGSAADGGDSVKIRDQSKGRRGSADIEVQRDFQKRRLRSDAGQFREKTLTNADASGTQVTVNQLHRQRQNFSKRARR